MRLDILLPTWIDRVIGIDAEWQTWIKGKYVTLRKWGRELNWYIFSHMIRDFRRPDIFITSIEKSLSLSRSGILIDISLDRDIFLRRESSGIPLPATRIGREISVKEMIVHPMTRSPPVSSTHVTCDPCDIHTQMIMHIACLVESFYSPIEGFNPCTRIREYSWHIMREDILLIEADIDHHTIGPKSFPYSEEIFSPSKLLQELLDLMCTKSPSKDSITYLTNSDESSRYIRGEHRHIPGEIVAIFTISYGINRVDTCLDTCSVCRECIVRDFHDYFRSNMI